MKIKKVAVATKDFMLVLKEELITPKTVWYHGTRHRFTTFDITKSSESGAFGPGIYFSDNIEDAKTWGNNIIKAHINGELLTLGMADYNTLNKFKNYLNVSNYGENEIPNILLYTLLERKYSYNKLFEIMRDIGYVGVEHSTPRLQFRGVAKNVVVFNEDAIEVIGVIILKERMQYPAPKKKVYNYILQKLDEIENSDEDMLNWHNYPHL